MTAQPITLYSSAPHCPHLKALADLLRVSTRQPVHLLPLSALPAPDTSRPTRQQLLNEKYGINCQLQAVQFLLTEFERQPERHAEKLTALRAERDAYQVRLADIARLRRQEGGVEL